MKRILAAALAICLSTASFAEPGGCTPFPAASSGTGSTAKLVFVQAVVAPLAGGRFKEKLSFSRTVRKFRTWRVHRRGAPYVFTPSPLRMRTRHAVRTFFSGFGSLMSRQLLTATFTFLMKASLMVIGPLPALTLQWVPSSAVMLFVWLQRLNSGQSLWSNETPTVPFTVIPNGQRWFHAEQLARRPLFIILGVMSFANLGSQFCGLMSNLMAGPVSSTAANQSQGIFMLIAGWLVFHETRFMKFKVSLISTFLLAGLLQPLIAYWGGKPFQPWGLAAGIGSAFSGAVLSAGFKILSYRKRRLNPEIVSYFNGVTIALFCLGWMAWRVGQGISVWDLFQGLTPLVALYCFLYGMSKYFQYSLSGRLTQSKEMSDMGWAQASSLPVHTSVDYAGEAIKKSTGLKFPGQPLGFWDGLVPFAMDVIAIGMALAQVDRPGLRRLQSERDYAMKFALRQLGFMVGISGSPDISEGPQAVLAADLAGALERHGLAPLDNGRPGIEQVVRQVYAHTREQMRRPTKLMMQSIAVNMHFHEDPAPHVEEVIHVNHPNARKLAMRKTLRTEFIFPGDFAELDDLYEFLGTGKPIILMEPPGDPYWETLFQSLSWSPPDQVFIAHTGEEAVQAFLRLERPALKQPMDFPKVEKELEAHWLAIDRWAKAFVFVGRPTVRDAAAAQVLAAALLARHHTVRLVTRGEALAGPVMAAAQDLGAQINLQAVFNGTDAGPFTALEKSIPYVILDAEHANHQVHSPRKDHGFIFFWEDGPKAVETLNQLFDLIMAMQMGKMDKVPLVLYGTSWERFARFYLEHTGRNLRPEDAEYLTIGHDVPETLRLLGVELDAHDHERPEMPVSVMALAAAA